MGTASCRICESGWVGRRGEDCGGRGCNPRMRAGLGGLLFVTRVCYIEGRRLIWWDKKWLPRCGIRICRKGGGTRCGSGVARGRGCSGVCDAEIQVTGYLWCMMYGALPVPSSDTTKTYILLKLVFFVQIFPPPGLIVDFRILIKSACFLPSSLTCSGCMGGHV